MADAHVLLAPLIEPPLPALPAPSASVFEGAALLPGLALALAVALLVAGWLWRRSAAQRALRRIARLADPVQAAEALAALAQAGRWQPDAAWQQALERVRFGAPSAAHAATVARLCAELRAMKGTRR
ncbi:MAG: hypothetical protein OEY75_07775 [Hylemonella sp.]|nr:hypothetical protein [Hylemonella sp.]